MRDFHVDMGEQIPGVWMAGSGRIYDEKGTARFSFTASEQPFRYPAQYAW